MPFLPQIYVKIDGSQVKEEFMNDLIELVVDTTVHLPDMFTIHLNDRDLSWIDDSKIALGKEVEISAKGAEDRSPNVVITTCEITSIEPEMSDGICTLVIRGYDKTHRLHRGTKTRIFIQSSDSNIVSALANDAGLSVSVDSTGVNREHVFQDYQTDIDFLRDLARRNGYYLYYRNGVLNFKKELSTGSGPDLIWGDNLLSFQARFSGAEPVGQAEVHGWDVKAKQAIIGKSTSSPGTPTLQGKSGSAVTKSAFSENLKEIINDQPVGSLGEANAFAKSILDDKSHAFFEAEGTCIGDPKIRAGLEITIKNVGTRFSGKYTLTRSVHRYGPGLYEIDFEISGRRPNTFAELLARPSKNPYGVVIGLVTNVNDPNDWGRVKVKYPTISDELESNWARIASPMAGAGRGIEFLPEVNDEVLVAFEYNDINRPYILGALWNGKDKPPDTTSNLVAGGKVKKRIIKSRSGHIITLDDSDGKEKITIVDKTGKNSIEIDSPTNALTIKTEGKINIETKDDVMIKGKNIDFEASANLNVNAKSNATVKAMSNINIEATTKATVKGNAGVDINASGPTNIKGAIINLN